MTFAQARTQPTLSGCNNYALDTGTATHGDTTVRKATHNIKVTVQDTQQGMDAFGLQGCAVRLEVGRPLGRCAHTGPNTPPQTANPWW